MIRQNSLADRGIEATMVANEYSIFFNQLLDITAQRAIDNELGHQIQDYVMGWLGNNSLQAFDCYSERTYQRNYLGRCAKSGWEAIVMSWKQSNRTKIHGHPQFAGYHFADGRFLLEIFEPCEHGVKLISSTKIEASCGFFSVGTASEFNNHIHRITCLSPTGHSLHVYSDDAMRGRLYDELD